MPKEMTEEQKTKARVMNGEEEVKSRLLRGAGVAIQERENDFALLRVEPFQAALIDTDPNYNIAFFEEIAIDLDARNKGEDGTYKYGSIYEKSVLTEGFKNWLLTDLPTIKFA